MMAFLMRVNMSAMGSVVLIEFSRYFLDCLNPLLPTGFHHSWNFAFQGKLTEADTAELKTTEITPRATAPLTAIAHPFFVLSTLLPYDHALFGHYPS